MSFFRALHTLNSVEAGALDSAALSALLADPSRYSEWQSLATIQGQVDRMWSSNLTIDTILGSGPALRALASVRGKHFYSAEYLKFMSPNAWAAYLPDSSAMSLGATGGISGWANAIGNPANDLVMTTVGNQPLAELAASPIFGQPVANFVSSDFMASTGVPATTGAAYTIFVVYRRADATASGYVGISTSATIGFGNSANGAATSFNTAQGTFSNNVGAVGAWAMSRFRRSGVSLTHSLNGGAESTAIATANMIPELTAGLAIGRGGASGGGTYMTGLIAEV